MKLITIRYVNGAIYGFPVDILAHHRATYYMGKCPDTTYQEEYDLTYRDWPTAYDWLTHNVSNDLLRMHLFEIKAPKVFDPIDEMTYGDVYYPKFFSVWGRSAE